MNNLFGQSIGRYHIIEKLGEGGMAVVYKALDTELDREVAIKVIQPYREHNELFLQRFKREARALAKLNNPNIIKVLDFGEEGGQSYLVMELVDGENLKTQLGKPLPLSKAVEYLIPIAKALGYAHEKGIIHRDVKPANILINSEGTPMLSDFGVAKMLQAEETADLTNGAVGVGTPEYMAPEQGMGQPIDARVDIYSLGVVFYEMITGRKPYRADTPMAVLHKQMSEPLPRPSDVNPDISQAAEFVVLKALSKDPEKRFQTMQDFVFALTKIDQPDQMQNRPGKKTLFSIGAIIILATLFAIFGIMNPRKITPPPRETAQNNQTLASSDLPLGELVFREDFDNNQNEWPTGYDGLQYTYIENGEYHLVGATTGYRQYYWRSPYDLQSVVIDQFYIEAKARYIEGTNKDDSYGILFGDGEVPNVLMIGNDQQVYSVGGSDNTMIMGYTFTPRIVKNGENVIGLLCQNKTLAVYINGYRVDEAPMKNCLLNLNTIGIDFGDYQYSAFDYFYVWSLDD